MGLLKAEQNDLKQAEVYLRTALKADPQIAQAAYNLCVITAKDRLDEAVDWVQKGDEAQASGAKIRIHSCLGQAKPDDAFVAVRYRNWWFWIDDRDFASKRLFGFLMFLFTLVEEPSKEGTPIVTIPAG